MRPPLRPGQSSPLPSVFDEAGNPRMILIVPPELMFQAQELLLGPLATERVVMFIERTPHVSAETDRWFEAMDRGEPPR